MILHEITQHNFETAVCSSLSEYFALCDRYSLDYYRGLSVKGSFPVSPFSLTRSEAKADRDACGVGVPRVARVWELGDVLSHSATPIVENDPQRSPEFHGGHSTSPSCELRIDWQDDMDTCQQLYRRMSGYMGTMQETEETVNVVDCASTGTSFYGNSEIEEIVGFVESG